MEHAGSFSRRDMGGLSALGWGMRGMLCAKRAWGAFFSGTRILPAVLFLLLLFAHGCAKYPASTDPLGGTVTGKAISRTAHKAVGVSYKPGGNSPKSGFDCSGLVCWAYAQNGVSVPRTTVEQNRMGTRVSKSNLQPGDVVVFQIRRGLHTGIYTGNGKFIHSPSRGKKVREEDMNQKYWKDKFIAGRRHKQLR